MTFLYNSLTVPLSKRKKSAFIYSLLLYIDPLNDSYAVNRWSNPQLKEIQLHCLTILSSVIIYMKEEYFNNCYIQLTSIF